MSTRSIWSLLLLAATLTTGSCSKENEEAPSLKFELSTGNEAESDAGTESPVFVVPGKTVEMTYAAENATSISVEALPEGWSAEVREADSRIVLSATDDAATKATLTVTATGSGTQKISQDVELYCLNAFDDPNGTFVLNEGNMTTENGSLTWISPEGYIIDDAYKTVNGTELGNVAQDMAFCDGKIYVISQNGDENAVGTTFENDGMLVVMDAGTLRKTDSFTRKELSGLDWPSHVAVLDEQHIYIRDNAGVYRLDGTTGTLTFVEGSDEAPKSQFVTMNGKVYTYKSGLMSKILEISTENDAVNSISLPFRVSYDINEVLGIQKSDDGKIWIMTFGFGKSAIGKFDPTTKEIKQPLLGIKVGVGSSGVAFAARGNDIYYADNMTIYHLAFDDDKEDDTNEAGDPVSAEEWMVDVSALDKNAGLQYNGLGVHPVTGRVYINTLKSFANYGQNQIWGFDFGTSTEAPAVKYENYTSFPAGFFFPEKN